MSKLLSVILKQSFRTHRLTESLCLASSSRCLKVAHTYTSHAPASFTALNRYNNLNRAKKPISDSSTFRTFVGLGSPHVGGLTAVRWASTSLAPDLSSLPPGYIPEPPAPLAPLSDSGAEIVQQLNALGEPTLQSLGLATWWPNGLVQWALESIHVSLDMPWWGTIVLTTLCLRLLMFPLTVLAQRNSANMHNHMPVIQNYQQKFQKARMSGNPLEAARAGSEYMDYMKNNKVNPMKSMLFPFTQVPVFLSVFIGIRQMANLPVESLTTGGILWFTDLTVADPYWALPLLTSATFLATMELGVDGVKATTLSTTAKYMMRAFPILLFPVMLNFPTAMLCYWFTSNVISLCQVALMRIPQVKVFCKIPTLVKHDPELLKTQKQPFLKSFKENYKNTKTQISMEDRLRDEAVKFKQAGLGAIEKTYDYDPTKIRHKSTASATSTSAVTAKKNR